MEPASTIISILGGDTAVARMLGINRVSVARWKQPKAVGGHDGRIPANRHAAILQAARARDISGITAEMLMLGGPESVEGLTDQRGDAA